MAMAERLIRSSLRFARPQPCPRLFQPQTHLQCDYRVSVRVNARSVSCNMSSQLSQAEQSRLAADLDTPLRSKDLELWLKARQISHAFHRKDGVEIPAEDIVKSIVFEVGSNDGSKPIVAVVSLHQKVDMKKLAAIFNVTRRQVKMASQSDIYKLCGYAIGCVPPLGHQPTLPVYVDCSLTSKTIVYGGGGDPDVELEVTMQDVLVQPTATLHDIAVRSNGDAGNGGVDNKESNPPDSGGNGSAPGPPGSSREPPSSGSGPSASQQSTPPLFPRGPSASSAPSDRQSRSGDAPLEGGEGSGEDSRLKVPWKGAGEAVRIRGVVVTRRRMSRLLVFATIAPVETALQPNGASTHKHPWRNPVSGEPCEVQIIMGQTIVKRLGVPAASPLLRKVKRGCLLEVTAVPQPRPVPAVPHPGDSAPAHADADFAGPAIDFVCQSVDILHDNLGAARQMRRSGSFQDVAGAMAANASTPVVPTGAAPQRSGRTKRGGLPLYQLPLAQESIHIVDSLEGLQSMSAALLGSSSPHHDGEVTHGDFAMTRTHVEMTPVGMDAEWQPYFRGEKAPPVSILQLATPDEAFIVDLQALCRSVRLTREEAAAARADDEARQALQDSGECHAPGTSSSSPTDSGTERSGSSETSSSPTTPNDIAPSSASRADKAHASQANPPWHESHPHLRTLTPSEAALSHFLQRFFAAPHLIKVGFAFQNDLHHIVASFPHLPCFASLPLRNRAPSMACVVPRPPLESFPKAHTAQAGAGNALPAAAAATGCRESEFGGAVLGEFELNSFVDLHCMACECRPAQRLQLARASLKNMVERLLGEALNKKEQCSAWAARPLTDAQVQYAVNDAHVLVVMFLLLASSRTVSLTAADLAAWRNGHGLLDVLYRRQATAVAGG